MVEEPDRQDEQQAGVEIYVVVNYPDKPDEDANEPGALARPVGKHGGKNQQGKTCNNNNHHDVRQPGTSFFFILFFFFNFFLIFSWEPAL